MQQDFSTTTTQRRKSRIGPGLLLKRAIDVGDQSTATSRQDHQDENPFRRSLHYYQTEPITPSAISQYKPISQELNDPVDQLCVAVDHLVEKMTFVADIHESLADFNETFGSFLYGLKMNAANVEWTMAPTVSSFQRQRQREAQARVDQEQLQQQQQQHEEEEQHQRQHIFEQEQEQERQRLEAERLEAEQMNTLLASQHSSGINNSSFSSSGMRLKRPNVVNGRTGASKIPKMTGAQAATSGPSRVGPGGAIRRMTGKLVMKRMADRLPLKYRDEPHRGPIEAIMRSLAENIEGQQLPELVPVAGVARHRCNEYLGVLVHAKEVIKTNHKGVLFSLNPDRYPSR
ncbi:hypothetical protein BG011_001774 [Mortierella polycephala]|uniref:DASH complex subunit DAM1 n=1 Tax=Mortierella polycephala TaxID=41804 RepID=A0A9P6QE35_9FUNG|nr:hypothetical protein BG011_001774 [Mortierella polycephala]